MISLFNAQSQNKSEAVANDTDMFNVEHLKCFYYAGIFFSSISTQDLCKMLSNVILPEKNNDSKEPGLSQRYR